MAILTCLIYTGVNQITHFLIQLYTNQQKSQYGSLPLSPFKKGALPQKKRGFRKGASAPFLGSFKYYSYIWRDKVISWLSGREDPSGRLVVEEFGWRERREGMSWAESQYILI